ncbi:hypothetical protein ACFO0A_00665 [Novosphingobium tardum]|uniref:Uncharacterized protein n=1 Tax=Novosphingobium tardum TaxID=1538021 RepID=A0ABV8RJJ0_9SPHN
MTNVRGAVERAFELARNHCQSLSEIRAILKAENFEGVDIHMDGQGLRRQLQALMKKKLAASVV